METKINITEILRNKPHGIKLYSPIFGDCTFCYIKDETNDICVRRPYNEMSYFNFEGLYNAGGECMLFPSKLMQDWSKFAWKRGDVLIRTNSEYCIGIFDKWTSDDYSTFSAKYINLGLSDNFSCKYTCKTEEWEKMENSKNYISEIERVMNGKLNLETLKIENAHPEFKDGDIVTAVFTDGDEMVCIFKEKSGPNYIGYYGFFSKGKYKGEMCLNSENDCFYNNGTFSKEIRLATEEEKKQLFNALEKEGKIWDVEKKKIIALNQKWTPKPFDRVITRNADDDIWTANIFSHMNSHEEYVTISCICGYTYCLPYNEETAKLIGTTNNVEG